MRAARRRIVIAGLLVGALLGAAGLHAVGAEPVPAEAMASASAVSGQYGVVTLVTGDQVLVRVTKQGEQVLRVRPAKGREGAKFLRRQDHGDTYVVPSDVAPKVAAGLVDRRLFNVSVLLEQGYSDRARADVPVIVTYAGGPAAKSAGSRLHGAGARAVRRLPSITGEAVTVPKGTAATFWKAVGGANASALATGVARVWLDGKVRATLDRSVPQIGAPTAWQSGHTGTGAKVAVLDSGVDTSHPDLADAVVATHDFTGSESGATDKFGHGTHVAGIITGSGAASGGKYRGVAPDATILNGKVLNDTGSGTESWVIAGMEWAVAQGADVVNMSLGTFLPSNGTTTMDAAVNALTRASGVLFVVAAGNIGRVSSIGSPGAADEALTVGAVDRSDQLASFSSRGPRLDNLAVKPDITAPGVDIVAPLADGAALAGQAPVVDGRYLQLSGTSMATPHVAGAAAILAAQHQDWKADRLKPALMGSAIPTAGATVYDQGAGRVDAARATNQTVIGTPSSVSLGMHQWPHTEPPVTSALTYRNDGADAVTLDVTVAGRDPAGNPAPAGMFTVDTPRVTVPAGGTATVNLVTNTSVPAPHGTYSALVTATGEQVTIVTPVGVTREAESYDLTLRILDRNGQPTSAYSAYVVLLAEPVWRQPYDESGTVVVRVRKGDHVLQVMVATPDESPVGSSTSIIVEPQIHVDSDRMVVVDSRDARPVGLTVDRHDARPGTASVRFDRKTAWGVAVAQWLGTDFSGLYVRPSQSAAPAGEFTYEVSAELAKPDGSGGFAGSPYLYHVAQQHDDRMPTTLVEHVGDRALARVDSRIAAVSPDQLVVKDFLVAATAPATLSEYYTPRTTWIPVVSQPLPGGDIWEYTYGIASTELNYTRAGQQRAHQWNTAVFGPSLTTNAASLGYPQVYRVGNTIDAGPRLYGDQVPHHFGFPVTDEARVVLYRNGEQVGESPSDRGIFEVPADAATYQLLAEMRQGFAPLSTSVSAKWTFRSAHTSAEQALPVMVVRFAPRLDDHNQAPGGRPFTVPLYIQRQNSASFGSLTDLRVWASYDDGRSWQQVTLTGTGWDRRALLRHQPGASFVSLRATAADSHGNTVEQTIIRAYKLH